MQNLKPMDAVAALYAPDQHDLSEAIIASLNQAIFHQADPKPASSKKIFLGRVSHHVVRWTTKTAKALDHGGAEVTHFKNRLFERSGHPYAHALLTPTEKKSSALVEGGDPMNGPYMMLSPEIRKNGGLWDRIFFDSVQSKDVQMRFVLETQATYAAACRVLERGESVRIKAVAAGTGLSLILVYDRLIREGFSPQKITAVITDRDSSNTEKSCRLIGKLATTRESRFSAEKGFGIVALSQDIFSASADEDIHGQPYQIVTAIGILEYFQGVSHGTTEQRLLLHEPEELTTAQHLVERLGEMVCDSGHLIINSYRDHACIRILELFGKRFDFRERRHLLELLAPLNFRPFHLVGSGHIYDVEVFEKTAI